MFPLLSKQSGYSFHIKPRCVLCPHHEERETAMHRSPNKKNIFNLLINGIKPQRRRAHGGLTKRLTKKQKYYLCLRFSGDGSWIAWSTSGLGLTYAFRLKTGRMLLRSHGIAGERMARHARGRGNREGGGKIILAKRYCSDLQSQVRPGENFLSPR